jgi:hypothetical protein
MPEFPTYPSPGLPVHPDPPDGQAELWDWLFQAPPLTTYPIAISGAYRTWIMGDPDPIPCILQAFLFKLETVGWRYTWAEVGDVPNAPANLAEYEARVKIPESAGFFLPYPEITIINDTSHPIYNTWLWEKQYYTHVGNMGWATTTRFSDGSYFFQSARVTYNPERNLTFFEIIIVGFSYTVGWYRRFEYVRPAAVPGIVPVLLPLLMFPLITLAAGAVVASSGGTSPAGRRRKV